MKYTIGILFLIFILSGCVSVNVAAKKAKKSDSYVLKSPQVPFEQLKTESADLAWKSKKTNNIISLQSECNSEQETSLQNIANSAYNAFSDYKTEQENVIEYNQREALQTLVAGKVDGVPVKMKSYFFKKNECIYTITYFGTPQKFSNELQIFDQFASDFKVP